MPNDVGFADLVFDYRLLVNGRNAGNPADVFHPSKAGYRDGFAPLIRAIMG